MIKGLIATSIALSLGLGIMVSDDVKASAKTSSKVCKVKGDKVCEVSLYSPKSPSVNGYILYGQKGKLYKNKFFGRVYTPVTETIGKLKFVKGEYKLKNGYMYKKGTNGYKLYSGVIKQFPNRVSILVKNVGEQLNYYTFKNGKIEKVKIVYKY